MLMAPAGRVSYCDQSHSTEGLRKITFAAMNYEQHPDVTAVDLSPGRLRSFSGPKGTEVFLLCHGAPGGPDDLHLQTEDVYRRLQEALSAEGGSLEHVLHETVLFRDLRQDLDGFLLARRKTLHKLGSIGSFEPASTFLQLPPLDPPSRLAVLVSAFIPHYRSEPLNWNLWACGCDGCMQVEASCRVLVVGGQKCLFAGNFLGSPGNTFEEAYSMFRAAEKVLRQEGLNFRSVLRTWVYLRNMKDDYAEFNRARTIFLKQARVPLRPVSTCVQAARLPPQHKLSMGFYAVHSPCLGVIEAQAMSAPSMSEAYEYGSELSRGIRVAEANKVALLVSGTGSVDEKGRTAHPGNFELQAKRMLLNVSSLLAENGALLRDLLSGVIYVKRPSDVPLLRRILLEHDGGDLPCAVVQATLCRPGLLCEMEALAALPLT